MPKAVVLPEPQVERIENILDELRAKTRAMYVFLADISGQLISARGIIGATDIVALAALAASNVAATAEIARQIGEKEQFHLVFHEGASRNIYLSLVGESFLLAVVFGADVQIGIVRLFCKRTTEELAALAAEYEALLSHLPKTMETDFDAALDAALDRLMSDR